MKKYLLLSGFLAFNFFSFAQEKFPFIARNSSEFINAKPDPTIENIHVDNSSMVVVKKVKGSESYKLNEVWGYRNKRGKEYRVHEGEEYEVLASGELCIYAHPVLEMMMSEGFLYPILKYYFSRKIDGAIYELNMENIEMIFTPFNPEFVERMKNWKWDYELIKFDRKNHEYKIEEIYKEVRKNS